MPSDVIIGYVCPEKVHQVFMRSFTDLLVHDARTSQRVAGWVTEQSGPWISRSRNLVVRRFLDTGKDWLWMVDSDIQFSPDTLDRLLARAERTESLLLAGLYFGFTDKPFPMLYDLAEDGTPTLLTRWERGNVVEVKAGTGAGCLLIHRHVLDDVAVAQHAVGNDAFPWFQEGVYRGDPVGEDIEFCMRARECGYPTRVDTAVVVRHSKPLLWGEDHYRAAIGWED